MALHLPILWLIRTQAVFALSLHRNTFSTHFPFAEQFCVFDKDVWYDCGQNDTYELEMLRLIKIILHESPYYMYTSLVFHEYNDTNKVYFFVLLNNLFPKSPVAWNRWGRMYLKWMHFKFYDTYQRFGLNALAVV